MTEIRLLRLGTVNGSPVMGNIAYLGGDRAAVSVTLSADYIMENPGNGWPGRPFLCGVSHPAFPYTILTGTTIALLQCEADALVTAGAATYA